MRRLGSGRRIHSPGRIRNVIASAPFPQIPAVITIAPPSLPPLPALAPLPGALLACAVTLASALAPGPADAAPWFTDVAAELGVITPDRPAVYDSMQMPDIMNAGAAVLDYDGDGRLDIYLVNQIWEYGVPGAANVPRNRLFRQKPDGTFEDVTVSSGIAHAAYGSGVAIGDYDNDGDPDIYSANTGPDVLFRNRGDGTFEDVTAEAGIDVPGWSCSAGFLDYDGDGHLDVFLTQYVGFDETRRCTDPSGRPEFCGPKSFPPLPDVLLHNEGDGTFRDVSVAAGIATSEGAGLGVVCEDLTGDRLVDIYVANDAYANNLWVNQGDGTFLDDALLMGSAFNGQGMAEAGMGVVASDFDDDGDFDLFMTHLKNETHTLYENLGDDMGFEDATTRAGISGGSMAFTGFGTFAFDMELDGDLDLFVANGAVNRGSPLPGAAVGQPWDDYAEPNQIWLSRGGALFDLLDGAEAGDPASHVEVSRGTAVGDLDNDGDLDLVLANCYSPVRIYRNDAPRQGHWLRVNAMDPAVGREAIGATLTVRTGARDVVRSVTRTASYQSSCDVRAHFGLGGSAAYEALDVVWPDGGRERFPGGAADREVTVTRGQGQAQ